MSKKKPEKYFEIEAITPELAAQYLELNGSKQRNMSLVKVDRLAVEMTAGTYRATGECIIWDWDGSLQNGQHRLAAVVKSGTTQTFSVCYNADPEDFKVIDQHTPRSSANLLEIMYKTKFAAPPSASTYTASIASGMLQRFGNTYFTRDEVAEHALKHYRVISLYLGILKTGSSRHVFTSRLCAAFANASLYFSEAKIMPLAERFKAGMWTSAGDPLKALFDRLLRAKNRENRQHLLTRAEAYGLAVSAIRACLTGARRTRLEASTQDYGRTDVDKKIRANERVRPEDIREIGLDAATPVTTES